jgi:hypothetical protein
MKKLIYAFLAFIIISPVKADEGMWLPFLLKDKNYNEMVRLGLKLTPEQIYDINNSSLKDAIVRLGRGFCTGEMISSEGLMLTNHHCGYNTIQEKSSVDHDYLKYGFWAMNKSQELPAGFSVSFLVRIEDVSARVMKDLNEGMTEEARNEKIAKVAAELRAEITAGKEFDADVKSMFNGNAFYMFVYQTFDDVRLVGAPPSNVGKYGGDTDNWMWPRHTGDFSMFRIYANKENKPAPYAVDNVPYKPKHHLPVSLKGVEKEDYAMIFGYPGSTDRYLTSYGVKLATEKEQPARVKIRRTKLDKYEEGQATSDAVRIQYAAKHAQVSNYWKYFIGQTKGLKRLHVYDKKKAEEDAFMAWVNKDEKRKAEYGNTMNLYSQGYAERESVELPITYVNEAIFGTEVLSFAYRFSRLEAAMAKKDQKAIDAAIAALKTNAEGHFKNYYKPIDLKVCAEMLKYYYNDIPAADHPAYFAKMVKKFKGDFNKLAEYIFKKSIFDDEALVTKFLANPSAKVFKKDQAYLLISDFVNFYRSNLLAKNGAIDEKLDKAARLYVKGLMEMNADKKYYPDANSTMRVTYGQVLDYVPADAVFYKHYTTINGVLEKYVPNDDEFDLPAKFIELAKNKDYGQYGKNDDLNVCFISNNDITGGNSGSPVINGNGELIGLAFDGNWEAMSGDIAFEPQLQRTISVDIRYVLWIIDKYAGATHLVNEMTLAK